MSGNLSSLSIGGGQIKSIQRGVIASPGTATITSVNTSKSLLAYLGASATGAYVVLTNSTTVTATGAANVSYQVVEYY